MSHRWAEGRPGCLGTGGAILIALMIIGLPLLLILGSLLLAGILD